jgi:hypothetical protein
MGIITMARSRRIINVIKKRIHTFTKSAISNLFSSRIPPSTRSLYEQQQQQYGRSIPFFLSLLASHHKTTLPPSHFSPSPAYSSTHTQHPNPTLRALPSALVKAQAQARERKRVCMHDKARNTLCKGPRYCSGGHTPEKSEGLCQRW